jgi:hypothetical protein
MLCIYIYNNPHIFGTVKYKTDAKKQVNPTTTTKYTLRKQLVREEVHKEGGRRKEKLRYRLRSASLPSKYLAAISEDAQLPTKVSCALLSPALTAARAPPRFAECEAYRVASNPMPLMASLPASQTVLSDTPTVGGAE